MPLQVLSPVLAHKLQWSSNAWNHTWSSFCDSIRTLTITLSCVKALGIDSLASWYNNSFGLTFCNEKKEKIKVMVVLKLLEPQGQIQVQSIQKKWLLRRRKFYRKAVQFHFNFWEIILGGNLIENSEHKNLRTRTTIDMPKWTRECPRNLNPTLRTTTGN